ncbi:MAG TPA: hypothetical protein VFZ89_00265, partial [Solirubrobacteraceae bacterium]
DPIMPLSEVKPGMQCTARSVVRGTDITSFRADVVDVVTGDSGAAQPYILIRVSGPAVEPTGIGPGFSGSPIYCQDGLLGPQRVIGALSEGVGEYGNTLALATPIELILGEPVDVPPETRHAPALVRAARPLALPLSVGGLTPPVATLVQRAAGRAKRVIYAAPARPRADVYPPQTLRPGSALAASLSSGDFTAGGIGTVAYVDGDRVWGFGHPLDSAGRRSLFLQDAYVYTVVNNPVGTSDLRTYKYASPGHDLGTVTSDGISAIAGRVGALPPRFPLKIVATDLDSGKVRTANMALADESALGLPTGISALSDIGGIALAQMTYLTLGGLPLRQSGSMCVRITVRERSKPMRFCNSYVGGPGTSDEASGGGPIVTDFATAAQQLDAFNFGPLHVTAVEVNLKLRRSLRLAYLRRIVKAPAVVQRGKRFRVTVEIQRQNGPKSRRVLTIRVPRGMPVGERALSLTGTSPDTSVSSASMDDALTALLDLGEIPDDGDESGARTVAGLALEIAGIHREDGVFAAFAPLGEGPSDPLGDSEKPTGPEAAAQKPRVVLSDPQLRIAGAAKRRIIVVP